jgi:hypothetical protein
MTMNQTKKANSTTAVKAAIMAAAAAALSQWTGWDMATASLVSAAVVGVVLWYIPDDLEFQIFAAIGELLFGGGQRRPPALALLLVLPMVGACAFNVPLRTERVTEQLDAAGNVVMVTTQRMNVEGWFFQHRPSDVTQMDTLNGVNVGVEGAGLQIGSASRASFPGYDAETVFPSASLNANAGGIFDLGDADVDNTIVFGMEDGDDGSTTDAP